jgi:hypothetical protein
MPIKEKSKLIQQEFEYQSPDGDKKIIVYIENTERQYVQIGNEEQDRKDYLTFDMQMIHDISDKIRQIKAIMLPKTATTNNARKNPHIVDNRTHADDIQNSVEDSMERYNDDEEPVQSFSPQLENKSWEEDAAARKQKNKSTYRQKGASGADFKRKGVQPSDLI